MNEASRKWLYDNLTKKGYNVGKTYDEFARLMDTNEQSRRWAYDRAKEHGLNVGKDFEQFNSLIGPEQVDTAPASVQNEVPEQPNPAQPIQIELPPIPTAQAKERQQAAVAGAQVGIQQATQAAPQPQPAATTEQEVKAPEPQKAEPEKPKKDDGEIPAGKGWKPTAQQMAGLTMPIADKNASLERQQESFANRMENMRKATQLGSNSSKTFNPATGQMEAEYYTKAGNVAANPLEQATENDISDALSSDEKRKQREQRIMAETEQRIESAISRVDPDNAAEMVWQQAEEAANEEFRQYLENQNKPTGNRVLDILGEIGRSTVANSVETGIEQMASNLKQKDLERMADRAWEALGPEKQQAITNEIARAIKPYYTDKTDEEVTEIASNMAREQSDKRMLDLAIAKNAPKDAVDYFLRKAVLGTSVAMMMESAARVKAGTTGDWAAREYAEQNFENAGNKIAGLAGTVTSFAIDPLTWTAAGVGGAAVKGAAWAGARAAGQAALRRGATAAAAEKFGEAVTRKFATTLGGRLLSGAIGGAGNFSTFEAGGEAMNQLRWGGHRDESGNVGDYSLGAIGERYGHGLAMGAATGVIAPLLGNVSDKLVRATESTAGKAGIRTGELAVGTLAEGTIFSVPEWIEGTRDAMDVWEDNMAMIAAFRVQHAVKSAPRVITELSQSPGTIKAGFETRLRSMLDGRDDLALTKDEQEELNRGGYSDLNELVNDYLRGEEAVKNRMQEATVDFTHRLTGDIPTNRFAQLMTDKSISQAARAKMYYYLTGRTLPMSTVMGSTFTETKDAEGDVTGYTVQSVGTNGVITNRTFTDRKRAEAELNRINRQAELNFIDTGEQYYEYKSEENRLYEACERISEQTGAPAKSLFEMMKKDPSKMTPVEISWANSIMTVFDGLADKYRTERSTERLRADVNAGYGVDIDRAIRLEPNRRTANEQNAVDYYKELLVKDLRETQEEAETETAEPNAPDGETKVKALLDADEVPGNLLGASQSPATRRGYDADLQERRDIAIELANGQAGAQEAWEGVQQRINEDAAYLTAQRREETMRMQQADGSIHQAILKEKDKDGNDRVVYIIEGKVQMMADGSKVDPEASDRSVTIYDPRENKRRMIDPTADTGILNLGWVSSPESVENAIESLRQDYIREQTDYAMGVVRIIPGQQLTLPTGEESVVLATDGDNIMVRLADGTQTSVLRSELQRYSDEQALADYNQRHGINPAAPEPQPEPTQQAQTATEPAAQMNGQTAGAPAEYTTDMELTVRDEDGQEKPAIVMGRVRYENGSFVPDENGRIVEYYMDGEVRHDNPDQLGEKVVSYVPAKEENAPAGEPQGTVAAPEAPTEAPAQAPAEAEPEATPAAPTSVAGPTAPEPAGDQPMPMKEDGEEDWQAVSPERAHTYIFNEAGLSRAEGNDFVAANREAAESSLKKAQSAQMPKMGKSIKAFNEAKGKRQEKIDEAKRTLDYWNQIQEIQKGIERVENDERGRIDAEKRRQLAALQAETERKRAEQEEAARRNAEALNGVPDMVDDTPQAARARGYRRVNGYKVDRQEPVQGLQGKEVSIKFSDNVMPQGRVAVINASQLQPSHVGGQRNPLHFIDEGQPKERNDRASIAASQKIAGNIRPEEITSSVTAFTGAPTVNRRGEVIQGNNRSDALRQMWQSYPEQAAKYKQYLMEHAEEFGLKPEDIEGMENPVLVNMLDVSDDEAITLGQYVAQDTESGGVERIKTKNALQLLGDDIGTFANRLLKSSGDEEMSFAELLDRNGVDVLKWMSQKGIITATQYGSAFDSRGNLSAEAKNDLRNILYQSIFKDGSTLLEEMFNTTLPAKAQKAILATAYRDYDSPDDAKMQPEIQSSIAAFNALWFGDAAFAGAKNYEEARRAVEAWKNQYQVDDATGESYLPAERFSNFALKLATIYRGQNQSFIQEVFNNMYDLIQGSQEATLFEVPDNTPRSLAEAIKETLNIDYDGQTRSTVLAGNGTAGEGGQRGSADVAGAGGASTADTVTTLQRDDRRGSAGGTDNRRGDLAQAEIDEDGVPFVKTTDGDTVFGIIAESSGLTAAPIKLRHGYQDTDGKGFGLIHIEANHGAQIRSAGFASVEDFVSFVAKNYDEDNIRVGKRRENGNTTYLLQVQDEHDNTLFIELSSDGSYWNVNSAGIFRKGYSNKKETVAKTEPLQPNNAVSPGSSLSAGDGEGISPTEPNGKPTVSAANIAENQQPAKQNGENLAKNAQPVEERALEREWNGYKAGLRFSPDAETDVEIEGFDYGNAGESGIPEVIVRGYDKEGNFLGTEVIPGQEFDDGYRSNFGEPNEVQASIAAAEAETNTEPSEAQKEAGNYKKGHVKIDGFDVSIENPKGSVRRGTDANGRAWEQTMQNTYGYIRGTEGTDGDHIDVFFSDDPSKGDVFVVDQVNEDGSFDEHKVMYGFPDIESARKAYLSNYGEGWQGLGAITHVSREEFKKWIESSHRKTKPFSSYKSVEPLGDVFTENGTTMASAKTDKSKQPYSITSTTYTNKKGKTSPMYLVKFGKELSKEELRAGKELARESKSWWDRDKGGFMMRDEESARKLAEALGNEEAVQDAQPLSVADLQAANGQADMQAVDEAVTASQEPQAEASYSYGREDDVFDKTLAELRERLSNPSAGAVPNLQAIKKAVRDMERRIKAIEDGMDTTPAEAKPQAYETLATLNGRKRAYEYFKNDLRKKLADDERDQALAAHGVKLGDAVIYRGKEAKITDIDGGRPVLDTGMAPVIYEVADWEDIGKVPDARPEESGGLPSLREVADNSNGKIVIGGVRRPEASSEAPRQEEPKTESEEPKQEGRSKWVDDADAARFEELRKRLADKLNGQLNIGMDPEIFTIGVEMSYMVLKHGARKFADFAKRMIEALGENVRPYLKTFYNGARDLPEMADLEREMTPYDEVRQFDVMNFDKKGAKDIIATAEHVTREEQAERDARVAKDKLKTDRNDERKEREQQVAADTEAVRSEATAVADEVEAQLPAAGTEREVNSLTEQVDAAIEKVNDQLAVLGYYEAEPVASDFNEAYGYMRNAEKKAVRNISGLYKELVRRLGIREPEVYDSKGKKMKPVSANIAPAGGDVSMRITIDKENGIELYMDFMLEPAGSTDMLRDRRDASPDDLRLRNIMWRIEQPNRRNRYLTGNEYFDHDVKLEDMLQDIRRIGKRWLPVEDYVAMAEDAVRRNEAENKPESAKNSVNTQKDSTKKPNSRKKTVSLQQDLIPDLFSGLFEEETKDNGYEQEVHVQSRPGTSERESGHQRGQNEPLGEGEQHEDERPDAGGVVRRSGSNPVSDTGRSASVSEPSDGKQPVKPAKKEFAPISESERKNTHNNHAERGTDYAPKATNARIEANIKAIETMQRLIKSGEPATPEDMAVLRKFSGWGGLGAAFKEKASRGDSDYNPRLRDDYQPVNPINARLRSLLSPEAYEAANMSRNSAYYTPAPVIDAMWEVARAMGFRGGNVLEGSAGIGNILGLMPTDMSDRSDIHAVEIDETTGNILSLLYPDANVEVKGFEKTHVPNGSVDLAITNVPFVTGLRVMDETGDKDLSRKFHDIHDFCIAKNVRKLKEGGIGIFISSSGTLDSPNSAKLRSWLVNEGGSDVVGAFRMHNQTFGGTGATSDIIVIRKRVNGRKSANAIDISGTLPIRTVKYHTGETKRGSNEEIVKDLVLDANKHFVEHPEDMAGEMAFAFEKGDTYRATSKALYPSPDINQEQRLSEWAKQFSDMDWDKAEERESKQVLYENLGEGVKEGSMILDSEGRICLAQRGKAVPVDVNDNKVKGHTKAECFTAYKAIKDALSDVLEYQTTHDDEMGLKQRLDVLNRVYDRFVKTYGHLNKNTSISFLRSDMDYPSIAALESFSETGDKSGKRVVTYGKTDIFSRRVVSKESEPKPTSIKDGIIASIYLNGRVDVPYIAGQLGVGENEVRKQIVEGGLGFENPVTTEMEVSYEYLSGNVREKLRQARENNSDGCYDANIKALERIIPMNIPAHLIEFSLGSSWVEPKLYEDYVKERTGLDVKLTNAGGTWIMTEPYYTNSEQNKAMGVISEKCDKTILGHELIKAAITCKSISVTKTITTGYGSDKTTETIVDKEATTACANKIDEIRQDFKDWARGKMQSDPEMSERMEQVYNDMFNNLVPLEIPDEFVPEHFGGAATVVNGKPFQLRPHQAKAVIRGTTQPLMLAHEVGTGKTYTLISTAMEMRRLGTARKPMIVVQNATVGQFVASAKSLYPNAKILTLEDADRNADGRRNFYAKIRYNDWDMIVVPQSVFERIPDSEERQIRFIEDKVEEKMMVLEKMREGATDDRDPVLRQAERELDQLNDELNEIKWTLNQRKEGKSDKDEKREAKTKQNAMVKAQEMLDRKTDDDVADFDDMGIDALLIDEAHEYKHLGFSTAMQRGVKGVDPSYSKKSQGVYLKTQAVLENNNGKNVVFATGTPISNTAAEIWTFMRYLMPADTMREYGIYYFDDFVRNFGSVQQMMEFGTNGRYKENNRFAGYVNLPELVRIWSGVADTVLTREAGGVNDKIPKTESGKAQDIYLPQTKALRSVMKYVKEQLDDYEKMSGKEKKENSHIPLVMYGIAKSAAVDARLVLEDAADEPNSKTNEAVRQTLRSLEDTKDYNGTVAIFADNYQNKATGFNLYEDIRKKLIASGVPESQVVVMKSGMSVKKKLELFDKVNRGEVRVIIGSTFTLGTGVNIQERLHTLIHIDAPNRPMDYTQRNGRILRQGNLHNTWGIPVRVLRFGVEDSLDVTAYQRLKTKGAIADSIMEGKKMMGNSMENRVLEEEQDLFGDITAQLSGSQYALLKNQVEKEVRKLEARKKQYEADQTYVHNQIPRLKGYIKVAEELAERYKSALAKVEAAKMDGITIGNKSFPSLEAMSDYIKDYNSKQREQQEQVRTSSGYNTEAKSDLTINVGGFDFHVHRVISKEQKQEKGQLSLTFFSKTQMTYSCPELGLEDIPVDGQHLKSALEDIVNNKMSGNDFRERADYAEQEAERYKGELEQVEARDGKPFEYADELKKAKEKLAEYEELMKAELAEKEAKYAEIDSEVEAAKDIKFSDEDSDEEEDTAAYRIREDVPPTNTGIGYKVFVLKDGKLYPPMVANPGGEATPVGVWLDADAAPVAGVSKTGRQQVKAGGKGTQGGSGKLAYRPGWHLGEIPYALQFGRLNPETGERELFPANFVWAEVEYAKDVDYQEEAMSYGTNANGKFQHSLAGLPRVPENGSYKYRTNPNPETDPWVITGAMKVNRILKPSEVDAMVEAAGREPQQRQAGAVTDEQVAALNSGIARTMREDTDMKRKAVEQMGAKLNTDIDIIEDVNSITHENAAIQAKRRKSKGWYDTRTGQVHIVLANNRDVDDAMATVGHETIAHKGLREMVGEERYDEFLDEVYEHLRDDLKKGVDDAAGRAFLNGLDGLQPSQGTKGRTYEERRRKAVDELFGKMAEKPFEEFSEGERTLWQKLKAAVRRLLDKFLGSLKLPKWFTLGDNELRYMLWRSKERMERGNDDPIDVARDIVKREELGLSDDRYRTDETADIWNDQSMGMQERITAAATRLAQNHRDNVTMRDDAVRAINSNLADLRKAMSAQRKFDITTAKRVSDLAKVLMEGGYLNDLRQQEVKRLLSAVKNSVGSEDIEGDVQKVMDIMVDNQLRHALESLQSLERIKGSKVDAKGVEVQGQLDADGAHIMKVFKEAIAWDKADIENRIADAMQRMGSNDAAVAADAALDYDGLLFTMEYAENIKDSITEEQQLREAIKEAKQDGNLKGQALKDLIASLEDAIRTNKIERTQAYHDLVGRLAGMLQGSIDNAKLFREADKQRIAEIQHNANSDMQGRPSDEHYKPKFMDKFVNNSFVSFLFAPLSTFDQMLRMLGAKSANGEGYLYNRFMRGWVDARHKEITGVRDKFARLDEKASELFGSKVKTWGDLIRLTGKMPAATVSFWSGGEMQNYELSQGNLMYIYMANKMVDGKMKLRRMGITEKDVENIEDSIDPRLIELADWLQDEFLVETRNEYNETHTRLFGASMAAIEHYFPLKILANARADKPEDLDAPDYGEGISTSTGSIIKRRRNVLALDITGADALNVILDHVAQMEHWNAFAEFNRDLNTLRTYKRFRNQVQNMTTIYGSGKELWKKFNDVCQMAAGTYRAPRTKLDEAAVNFAKGVTAAKVSFRIFTALKQFLSAPAYIPEARPDHLIADIINPKGAWTWCMDNLPIFNERWRSRIAGDPRLLKSDMDWKMWRSRVVQIASRIGMSPNAFVDALTVCIGAHAMYKTRLGQYEKDGYSREEAEKKAKQDAEVLYNETQQSSEGPFTSTMQVDRSWLSVLFTVFRNASMSYQRQLHDALRNFKHNLTPGGREKSIEFMRKQYLRDGIEYAKAEANAKRKFNRQIMKDTLRVGVFGYIMQYAWNLGAYLPYLLFGDDDNEKQKMWDDVNAHTAFGSLEGLTGGDVLSQAGAMLVTGEGNPAYLSKDMPLTSDIVAALQKLGSNKQTEAVNDIVNLVVQSGIGMNPQSITDAVLAIMDACGGDPELAHEAAICVFRILQVPQSQIDKMYFDEIDLSGDEVSKYTPAQLAERYARFKVKRGNFFSPWSWSDGERLEKMEKKATKSIKERIAGMGDAAVNEAYGEFEEIHKAVAGQVSAANKMKKDYVEYARLMAEAQSDEAQWQTYQLFKSMDTSLDKMVKMYLESKSAEEAELCKRAILDFKAGMVKALQAKDDDSRAKIAKELEATMKEFSDKYAAIQSKTQVTQ